MRTPGALKIKEACSVIAVIWVPITFCLYGFVSFHELSGLIFSSIMAGVGHCSSYFTSVYSVRIFH